MRTTHRTAWNISAVSVSTRPARHAGTPTAAVLNAPSKLIVVAATWLIVTPPAVDDDTAKFEFLD
jgi:hypothetical protein